MALRRIFYFNALIVLYSTQDYYYMRGVKRLSEDNYEYRDRSTGYEDPTWGRTN
jgi:hypothetical protein